MHRPRRSETLSAIDERLDILLREIKRRPPVPRIARLREIAAKHGVNVPQDYVDFMPHSDGGEGGIGATWLQLWTVAEIVDEADSTDKPYDDVFLFAGNGANTIYGFDRSNASEIIEGDWIGLGRDEVIPHGRTFVSFLESLAHDRS